MRDVTLLIAHPDDEAIFLWPFLDRVKKIVCASSDLHNPARAWCKERGECLAEVGKLLGCEYEYIINNADSEFYRLPTRDGTLKRHMQMLADNLRERDVEIIATHNAWGEYGNIDHILCHHIARTVQAETKCQVLVTDIAQEINWLTVRPWVQSSVILPGNGTRMDRSDLYTHHIDRPLYGRIKAIYDARGCWTWSFPVQETCREYSI